jgi:uncharacterized membrane protein
MKAGVWFYGLGTVLTGVLDLGWRAFDASHQPITALGNVPGQNLLACIAGIWLVVAGFSILWQGSAKVGAAACAIAYLGFAAFWLFRYHSAIHMFGWRLPVLLGVSFGLGQQLLLVAPAAILYVSMTETYALWHGRVMSAAGWMLGLPLVIFGLFHLAALRVFASIVPHWMGFGHFWAAITGIAFILAGVAICFGKKDVLAAKLLALMLLLFEFLVEIPPIFLRLHDQKTWGAAVYNLAAIGACLIFAESVASRSDRVRVADSPVAHTTANERPLYEPTRV